VHRQQQPSPIARRHAAAQGFTLVEIIVVIAIAGLLMQIVTSNMGAMIPSRGLDSAAAKIISQIDFLRSESRLQGKAYQLELDLSNHRYRMIIPPEERLLSTEATKEAFDLGWTDIGDNVEFAGLEVLGAPRITEGSLPIIFDKNGFTADQTIFLTHKGGRHLIWSVQVHGVTGAAHIERSPEGVYQPLERVEEGQF